MWDWHEEHGDEDAVVTAMCPRLAVLLFARSPQEAGRYCEVLEASGVPAVIGDRVQEMQEKGDDTGPAGFPVLVPETLDERASETIASLDAISSDNRDEGDEPLDDEEDEDDDEDLDSDDDDFDDEDEDDESNDFDA